MSGDTLKLGGASLRLQQFKPKGQDAWVAAGPVGEGVTIYLECEDATVIWTDANADLRERNLFKNRVTGTWRMTVRFKRNDAAKPVELRAYLKHPQGVLTETWSYILPAEADKP